MNKRTLIITAVVGLLLVAGAVFGYYTMKMNEPAFRGRAIPVQGIKEEIIDSWESAFKEALNKDEVLTRVIKESNYASALGIPEGEAVDHLRKAIKVQYKKKNSSIEVGFVGKRKDDEKLKAISKVLYQEAEKEVVNIAPSYQEYLDFVSENR